LGRRLYLSQTKFFLKWRDLKPRKQGLASFPIAGWSAVGSVECWVLS
jgi:hypothetical protein